MANEKNVSQDNVARTAHPVVLFDGICNLCTWSVQFIVQRDPNAHVRFASLQSDVGQALTRSCDRDPAALDSFVLIEDDECFTESEAALRLVCHLSGWWPLLGALRIVPRRIRDFGYRVIAANRYRWFGQRNTCMVPTPSLQNRFLPDDENRSAPGTRDGGT